MKQWKKYVGYDSQDQSSAGEESANPGSLDNSHLLTGTIARTLISKVVYTLHVLNRNR